MFEVSFSLTVGRVSLKSELLRTSHFFPHLFSQRYLPLLLVPSGVSKNCRTHNHIILGLKEKEDYLTQVIPFSDEENEAPKMKWLISDHIAELILEFTYTYSLHGLADEGKEQSRRIKKWHTYLHVLYQEEIFPFLLPVNKICCFLALLY